MNQSIQAIYEDGVFKPLDRPELNEHERVHLTVHKLGVQHATSNADVCDDPLRGLRAPTGIVDLAEHFDDYRFGRRRA